ncbi:hypothetical protein CRG98_042885 [Punica granatum]|uniref:Uncharacterized protein n=1 Tax=Punica granatum TaxID=22663 RepID=A0A2I0HYW3_PUNGR|nr:hypothetical protein CRG98_042885 [Punica granatum]
MAVKKVVESVSTVVIFVTLVLLLLLLHNHGGAQAQAQPITDPSEVRALTSLYQQWGKQASSAQWNISKEPCQGAAVDDTDILETAHNPFFKCDCSYDGGSTCHITKLYLPPLFLPPLATETTLHFTSWMSSAF